MRLIYYLLGHDLGMDILLFADDIIYLPTTAAQTNAVGIAIFFLTALGVPFGWKKFRGGHETSWIGFWVDPWVGRLGISEARAQWLISWLRARAGDGARGAL